MADNKDVNDGSPAADIPDLKKKDKERKKAGAAWSGVKPGGSFSGAGGGVARAAASAAGAGGAAAEAAGASWLSSMLATLTATLFGKALLALGVLAMLLGAGMLAAGMLKGGAAGAGGAVDLGAIASSMKVRVGGNDRTGVASKGEIAFDPIAKPPEAKKPEPAPDTKTAGDAVPADKVADGKGGKGEAGFDRPGLEHNMSGSKLSSGLGGGFGGKNIFAGNSNAPKLNEGLSNMKMPGGQKGKLSATRSTRTGHVSSGAKGRQMKGNRAMAQLKITKGLSVGATGTSGAAMASQAGSAFDGGLAGGNVNGGPPGSPEAGAVTSPSTPGGAPDTTAPAVPTPPGVDMDGIEAQILAGIVDQALAAKKLRDQGTALIIAGFVVYAAGIVCLCWPLTAIGLVLIAIGLILIGIGAYLQSEADKQEAAAYKAADDLYAKNHDLEQYTNAKICIRKAIENGTSAKDCDPKNPANDAERERLNKEAVERAKREAEANGQTGP